MKSRQNSIYQSDQDLSSIIQMWKHPFLNASSLILFHDRFLVFCSPHGKSVAALEHLQLRFLPSLEFLIVFRVQLRKLFDALFLEPAIILCIELRHFRLIFKDHLGLLPLLPIQAIGILIWLMKLLLHFHLGEELILTGFVVRTTLLIVFGFFMKLLVLCKFIMIFHGVYHLFTCSHCGSYTRLSWLAVVQGTRKRIAPSDDASLIIERKVRVVVDEAFGVDPRVGLKLPPL